MSNNYGSFPGGTPGGPGYGAPQQPYGQQYSSGPSYGGYPPPNYGTPQGTPAATKVKPSLGWIFGAWFLAIVSVIIGIVAIVGGGVGLVKAVADAAPTESFASGETVTVSLDPANKPAIYISTSAPTKYECSLQGASEADKPRLEKSVGTQTVTLNGVVWEQGLRIGIDKAGDYQVRCVADQADTTKFGVGREFVTGAVAGVVAGFGIPLVGILLAIVVTIVVLVKRSRARKRQAAAAAPAHSAGPWGQTRPYGS
ncbi:hypothetical protein FHS43_003443 [Streptosporangium becharense]|uniref:Putative membrane protein n=1 Tax=Streptosporangium becharense TaxID=1816182 RepID=A0A7W9MFE5_9ACTN|nr:hypothetical protein [Streptosporangium becharense]MBB2912163.1 hypothetical protein [Streptosporangium becharense]MBB5818710.1 putative membrane protein [Streptosporangium becharense]